MFQKEFKHHTGKVISIDEIGYETVWLYKEEIDEALILFAVSHNVAI